MLKNDRAAQILFWGVVVIIVTAFIGSFHAKSHQAPSGWTYPVSCCHELDCGVATKVDYLNDGSIVVTTKHGTARFEREFEKKPSPDGEVHACFNQYKKYCLFIPAGV